MKKLCKDFLKCGTLGWCLEILVSGAEALRRQDKTLTCHTSLWMFPIYGCACLIGPFYRILKSLPKAVRGLIYSRNAPYDTDGGQYYVRLGVTF